MGCVASDVVKVRERVRSGFYTYTVEGGSLVHISRYATGKSVSGETIIYDVPLSSLSGKTLYCFRFRKF